MILSSALHATERTQPISRSAPERAPVLVAGGGPVGLAAALELAWRGVECVLVEPRRRVSRSRPRAKTTDVRTMEAMRRWGIADELRTASPLSVAWSDRVVFCETLLGPEIARIDGVLGLSAERVEDWAEAGQQVPQFIVEDVLRAAVVAHPAITALFGWSVDEVHERADGVSAQLTSEAGDVATVHARYAIGADGARSRMREAIGARLVGDARMRPTYSMVIRAPGLAERVPHEPAVHYWVLGEVAGNLGRLDLGDIWWLGAHGVSREEGETRSTELVHRMVGAPIDVEVLSTDPWVAQSLIASKLQSERILLVGDAAHLLPPWGGHGYNTGVSDAIDAAWRIAAVLDGQDPDVIGWYEAERRPFIEAVRTRSVSNMATLAVDLSDGVDPAEVARRKEPEFRGLSLLLGYQLDAGWAIQPHPPVPVPPATEIRYTPRCAPGTRLPHLWLTSGESLYDRLGRGLGLIVCDAAEPDLDAWRRAASLRGFELSVIDVSAEPHAAERLGTGLVIVRPDHVVAWTGPVTVEPEAVLSALLRPVAATRGSLS